MDCISDGPDSDTSMATLDINNYRRRIQQWTVSILFMVKFTLTLSQTSSGVYSASLLKTLWEMEKLLFMSNFSISHSVFLSYWRTFCHIYQIQNRHLQTLSIWKSVIFVVWERVKRARKLQTISYRAKQESYKQSVTEQSKKVTSNQLQSQESYKQSVTEPRKLQAISYRAKKVTSNQLQSQESYKQSVTEPSEKVTSNQLQSQVRKLQAISYRAK